MKTKVSPTIVGFFVLGAFLIGMIGLFSFGSLNLFGQPQSFMVYFDETVSGLDAGSPVKLRGVRVGRVKTLSLTYDDGSRKSVVAVLCELNRDVMFNENGDPIDVADRAELEHLINRGLRAQLGIIGLATGLLYVELDFKDPLEYPEPTRDTVHLDYAIVPAVPSTIAEFQATFTDILADVKEIDISALAAEFSGLLVDSRRQINALNVTAIGNEWTAAAQSIQQLAESPRITQTLANLDGAITDLRGTLNSLDAAIDPTSTELASTLAEARASLQTFNEVARTAQSFLSAQSGAGAEAIEALRQLGEASQAIARLAEFIERNPSAILTGRVPKD